MDRRSNIFAQRTIMRAEVLESRDVPSVAIPGIDSSQLPLLQQPRERFAVAASSNGVSQVNVYDARTNSLLGIINPKVTGNLSVATGDVTGDGIEDLIVGTGAGSSPLVKVYDGKTLAEIGSFRAYSASFHGGVTVAVGDVNGDGRKDIITGTGKGSLAQIKVFNGASLFDAQGKMIAGTPKPIQNFIAFDNSYRGGVNVAAGDTDGDGRADIIVGKNRGNAMDVAVFSGKTGASLAAFSAYDASFKGGVTVAAGDTDGDGKAEVIVGANTAPANNVKVFAGSVMVAQYSANTGWGARVGTTDIDGDGIVELVAVSGPNAPPKVNILSAANGSIRRSLPSMPGTFTNGLNAG